MAKTITLHGHRYVLVTAPSKVRDFYNDFCRSSDVELRDVYGSYSQAKANAYEYCREREREFGSYNGVISSYCIMQFTYSFTGKGDDGNWYLIRITKDYDYAMRIPEDF